MRRRSIIPFAAVLPFGSIAFAQNWTNAAGGSWGVPSNWQGDALPNMPNFDLGSTGYTVTLDKRYVVPSVTVQTDTVTIGLDGFTLESPALNIGAGPGGSLTLLGPGEFYATNPVSGGSGEVSGGQLTVNNATISVGGGEESGAGFSVSGLLVENGGSISLTVPGSYSASNGMLNDGTLEAELGNLSVNNLNLSNGSSIGAMTTFLGSAIIDDSSIGSDGSMTVSGTVTVQDHGGAGSPETTLSGTVNILPTGSFGSGDLTVTSTGMITIELNSQVNDPTSEPYSGNNGTLDITLQPGFEPFIGEQFDIFGNITQFGPKLTGTFATLNLPVLPTSESWDTSDLYTTGVISVVPEPTSLGLIVLGITGLSSRRRRGRSSN